MSVSATPNALTRATTALIRRPASLVASARPAACDSTPSVSSAVSGATATRPVPLTTMAFAGSAIAAIYTSPLARARESAEPLAAAWGVPLKLQPDFREMGFGDWEGLTREEVAHRFPEDYAVWRTTPERFVRPGGEPLTA